MKKGILYKRAKAKYFTTGIVTRLVDCTDSEGQKKKYWDTYHCTNEMFYSEEKFNTHYCRRRECLVCNRIKTAEKYKGYEPELKNFEDPVLLTLTIRSFKNNFPLMRKTMNNQNRLFSEILAEGRRQGREIKGVRVFEVVTYAKEKRFHSHIHCIINNQDNASFIRSEWLSRSYKHYFVTDPSAQDIREIKGDNAMKEVFKYPAKIIDSAKKKIDFEGLNVFFENIANFRTIQAFGIKKAKDIELTQEEKQAIKEELKANNKEVSEGDRFTYVRAKELNTYDWINNETGEGLTDYRPTANERSYFEKTEEPEERPSFINSAEYQLRELHSFAEKHRPDF